jgi:hypothetical protein
VAQKSDFTAEEWKALVGAMPMVGMAVAVASPSGPIGLVKEMMSIGMAIADVLRNGSPTPLINAMIEDLKARNTKPEAPAGIATPAEAEAAALAALKNVSEIVGRKCGLAEATAYKQWLLALGHRVAEASNEGGFLGIGGVRVSDAEKAALGRIAASLNISG